MGRRQILIHRGHNPLRPVHIGPLCLACGPARSRRRTHKAVSRPRQSGIPAKTQGHTQNVGSVGSRTIVLAPRVRTTRLSWALRTTPSIRIATKKKSAMPRRTNENILASPVAAHSRQSILAQQASVMALARSRKTRRESLFESLQYYSGSSNKQSSITLSHCDLTNNWLPPTNTLMVHERPLRKKRCPLARRGD